MALVTRLIPLLTFPGVIMRTLVRQIICKLFGISVYETNYFSFDRKNSSLIYDGSITSGQTLLVGLAPFIINSLLGIGLTFTSYIPRDVFSSATAIHMFLYWVGFSLLVNAVPTSSDAKYLWHNVMNKNGNILIKIITFPIILLMFICAIGSFFWLDFIYALFVGFFVPTWILTLL